MKSFTKYGLTQNEIKFIDDMIRPMQYFFPSKPDNHPKIYAFTEYSPEYQTLIRIGYTKRSLDERMKEHYPTKGPNNIKRYKVLLLNPQ